MRPQRCRQRGPRHRALQGGRSARPREPAAGPRRTGLPDMRAEVQQLQGGQHHPPGAPRIPGLVNRGQGPRLRGPVYWGEGAEGRAASGLRGQGNGAGHGVVRHHRATRRRQEHLGSSACQAWRHRHRLRPACQRPHSTRRRPVQPQQSRTRRHLQSQSSSHHRSAQAQHRHGRVRDPHAAISRSTEQIRRTCSTDHHRRSWSRRCDEADHRAPPPHHDRSRRALVQAKQSHSATSTESVPTVVTHSHVA